MTIRPPQRILNQILLRRDRMIQAIQTGIDHTFTAAERGCAGSPGEVDRLVYFFLVGLPAIEGQFNVIFQGSSVRATLSGIFCHQTPRVTPIPASGTNPPGCELGDILFLVTYGGRIYSRYLGNALLVQAKEDASTVDGTTQAHLYENATAFTYNSPGDLAPQRRSLADCDYALWYWGFRHQFWNYLRPWQTEGISARPRNPHGLPMPFERTLMDLICGVNGRRVRALPAGDRSTGWSKIVDDLIRVTARSSFTRRNAYVSRDREPLRGEEITHVLRTMAETPNAPFLIRCSLDRIFSFFDEEMAALGKKLTTASQQFNREEFLSGFGDHKAIREDNQPPSLGNTRPKGPGDDGGGCSFVIMDFS